MECPFCGGEVVRVKITGSGGERAYSLCCDMPLEFIDNYDVFGALPAPLQQVAIARKKAEYDAMVERSREEVRRFRESKAQWEAQYRHLAKES